MKILNEFIDPSSWVNIEPVADAGVDQTVAAGEAVMLDGSGSYDPDNDLNPDNACVWKQTAGPAVTLSAPGAIDPTFMAPAVADGSSETLVFELTITDSGQLQATDIVEIVVNGATPPVVEPPDTDRDHDDRDRYRYRKPPRDHDHDRDRDHEQDDDDRD